VRRAKTTSPEPITPATSSAASATSSETATAAAAASTQSTSALSISQRGRRRSAKKYWQIEETADPRDEAEAVGELYSTDEAPPAVDDAASEDNQSLTAELDNEVEGTPPDDAAAAAAAAGRYFQFELLPVHTGSRNRLGRKMFECDVCAGVYRHGFSLKRHYLRNHINRRYISRVDALNCNMTYCGGDDDDDDEDAVTETARHQAARRPRAAPAADEDPGRAAGAPESGGTAAAGRPGDDGATLQMDVDEIAADAPDSPDVDGPRQTADDFPGLYRCYVCERHFDSVGELKSHVCDSRVAGGAGRRFACRHCQMQFRHRQNLVRHELVHTGIYQLFSLSRFFLLLLLLHPFNGLFSRTTWVSWYQKGKTSLDLNEARDDAGFGMRWHQLDNMRTVSL